MALTTTTEIDAQPSLYYDRLLLERALPELVHELFGQQRNIPAKSSAQIKFRRYSSLSKKTTPVPEGVTPTADQLAKTDLTATASQYIGIVEITDVIDLTVPDPVMTETVMLQGEQLGQTRDELIKNVLAATASVTDAAGGSNGNTPTEVTEGNIKGVRDTLMGNNAKFINRVVTATTGIGTTPVRAGYWGIAHSDSLSNLESVTGFLHTSKYPAQSTILEAEWGATGNVRWVTSSEAHYLDTTVDEYKMLIFGKNAYGNTSIANGNISNIRKPFGSGDDPANQRATSAWKMWHVTRILNDNFMHALNTTL